MKGDFVSTFVAAIATELSERGRYVESRSLTRLASIHLGAAFLLATDYENEWL